MVRLVSAAMLTVGQGASLLSDVDANHVAPGESIRASRELRGSPKRLESESP